MNTRWMSAVKQSDEEHKICIQNRVNGHLLQAWTLHMMLDSVLITAKERRDIVSRLPGNMITLEQG